MYYIYKHTNLDTNEVFYIGCGTKRKDTSYRATYARAYSKCRSKEWKDTVEGINYSVEIIAHCSEKWEAIREEQFYISLYGRKDLGLGTLINHTNGGDGIRTEESNAHLSKINLGRLSKKAKYCYKYSKMYAFIERYDSFNIAAQANNLKKQNVLCAKDQATRSGGFYWFDELLSKEEIRRRIQFRIDNHAKPGTKIHKIDPKTGKILKTYNRIVDATREHTKKDSRSIEFCLRGRNKTSYGFKWKYADK